MGAEIDLDELVGEGAAVVVATRDRELRPELGRGWGPVLSEGGARLTVCVEAGPDSVTASNLASGSPATVILARLAAQTTVQLKGAVVEFGEPTQDRLDAVAAHVERFVAETAAVGVPEPIARALVGTDLLTVAVDVAERVDGRPL